PSARPVHGLAPGLRYLAAAGKGSGSVPAHALTSGERPGAGHCPLLPGPGGPPRPATARAGRLADSGTAGLGETGPGTQPGAGTWAVPPATGNLVAARPGALPAGVWISGASGPVLRTDPDP